MGHVGDGQVDTSASLHIDEGEHNSCAVLWCPPYSHTCLTFKPCVHDFIHMLTKFDCNFSVMLSLKVCPHDKQNGEIDRYADSVTNFVDE